MASSSWFEVNKEGLAKLVQRRGLAWVVFEVIQNALDEKVSFVNVSLTPVEGRPLAVLRVEDDSPEGFRDLSHAWTLFAESYKKEHDDKRGRFNLGEKLVLALAEEATISTTTGLVKFTPEEGRVVRRGRVRTQGTVFAATIRMTRVQIEEVSKEVQRVISDVPIRFNETRLPFRKPCAATSGRLMTEVAEEGLMKRVYRVGHLNVLPRAGETGWLYEMGMPVCETGDTHDYNLMQRVPLGMERDGVPESFLRDVRALAIKALTEADLVDAEVAEAAWVGDALEDEAIDPKAVVSVIEHRYGEKRVIFDPSDTEANRRAAAEGYAVVPGGAFSKAQWANIKGADAMLPAGKVTPTAKPFSPDGKPLDLLPPDKWTTAHHNLANFATWMAEETLGQNITVVFSTSADWNRKFNGAFSSKHLLYVADSYLRKNLSEAEELLDFLIHEFGHVQDHDHLDPAYHEWLTRIGARVALALREKPDMLGMLTLPYISHATV